jgi:excisionase family DNA binding protein
MTEETVLPPDDIEALEQVRAILAEPGRPVAIVASGEKPAPLPAALLDVLVHVVDAMRHGQAVTLGPRAQRLTTQEAADLLGISRPTLIKLLEDGKIPYETPGRHRRIKLVDLLTYQALRSTERQRALAEMTEEAQELGLYDQPAGTYETALAEARKKLA